MQLVWSHKILGLLLDVAILIGRYQLRTDRCVDDIEQGVAALLVYPTLCHIVHQVANQGLGYAGIHTVHAHVVAIVGGPSQSEFRQVACTYHHSSQLVGKVHQYLCTLACL